MTKHVTVGVVRGWGWFYSTDSTYKNVVRSAKRSLLNLSLLSLEPFAVDISVTETTRMSGGFNWMPVPQVPGIPDCPAGLEFLLQLDRFIVSRYREAGTYVPCTVLHLSLLKHHAC